MKRFVIICIMILFSVVQADSIFALQTAAGEKVVPKKVHIPPSVLQVTKENTYPNPLQDLPLLQPSELTEQLITSTKIKIENPELIHMLNESAISKSPFAFGYRATIYLGHWALNYQSSETSPNWEYQKINTNYYDNRGGDSPYSIHYVQEAQKTVRGGLTAKIPQADDVQKMMLVQATEKTKLPLAFETIVGGGTKKDQVYNVPAKRLGYLFGYASAVNEKGKVTYGEVYLHLTGSKRTLTIKNITSQGIGAWIPIQDHLAFSFTVTQHPR